MADSSESTQVQRNLQAILKWSIQQQDTAGSGSDSKVDSEEKASQCFTLQAGGRAIPTWYYVCIIPGRTILGAMFCSLYYYKGCSCIIRAPGMAPRGFIYSV